MNSIRLSLGALLLTLCTLLYAKEPSRIAWIGSPSGIGQAAYISAERLLENGLVEGRHYLLDVQYVQAGGVIAQRVLERGRHQAGIAAGGQDEFQALLQLLGRSGLPVRRTT